MESQMQLIIIKPNNAIDLYDKFILRLNLIKNRLTVLPPKDEGKPRFKRFHITFKRNYIHQNIFQRIICIDECETDSKKYVLIFNTVEKCLNFIESVKNSKAKDKLTINVTSNDEIFKFRYLPPIIKIGSKNQILDELLQSILLEILLFYNPTAAVTEDSNVPQSENERDVDCFPTEPSNSLIQEMINNGEENLSTDLSGQHNGEINEPRRSLRKRFGNSKYQENEIIENCNIRGTKRKNSTKIRQKKVPANQTSMLSPSNDDIIYAPNFEIINYVKNGVSKSRLFIFQSSNKEMCYEYFYNAQFKKYICIACYHRKHYIGAMVKQGPNEIDYVQCQRRDHTCELRKFESEKFQSDLIIKKPNYDIVEEECKGKLMKYLLLYTSTDKQNFYKLTYLNRIKCYLCTKCHHPYLLEKRRYITAHTKNDDNGNEFVSVRNLKHSCSEMENLEVKKTNSTTSECQRNKNSAIQKPKTYQKSRCQRFPSLSRRQNIDESKIIRKPNFQLFQRKVFGKMCQKLAVFDTNDSTMCHELTWSNRNQYYMCNFCINYYKIHVYARIIKYGNEDELIQMGKNDHACKLKKFVPR